MASKVNFLYLFCGLCAVFASVVAAEDDAMDRRLREGNSFSRRLRSCNLFCALRNPLRSRNTRNNTELCYVISSQNNETVTECAYRCLRFLKGGTFKRLIIFAIVEVHFSNFKRIELYIVCKSSFSQKIFGVTV